MSIARLIAAQLGRWPAALAACLLLAAVVLLPRLGSAGLWEPQERQLADRVAPPIRSGQPATKPAPPDADKDKDKDKAKDRCLRTPPADAAARSLTSRALVLGRDELDDSDAGRRWPLAVLGLFTVLAAAGTAMRLAGPRAGVVSAIVLLAMPLL
ncbi:MAG: hypothetical protein ABIY55_23920, partial [Kofleriaceae bacterium]